MLTLWVMEDRPFGAERPLVAAVLRAIDARRGDAPLQVHSLAWSRAWSRVRNAILEGSLPDVLEVGTTWLPALLALGVLVPAPAESPRRPRWPHVSAEERRHTVPWTWDIRFLYYSRGELGRVGMHAGDLGTMAGLEEAARRVRDAGRREPFALSGRPEPALVHNSAPWLWAEGGHLDVTPQRAGFAPGSPGFRGLTTLLRWAREGLIARSALERGGVEVNDDFARGRYAFTFGPALGTAWGALGSDDTAVVPVPVASHARTTFSGGSLLAVTRGSSDPDGAWRALASLSRDTRSALASHHAANRRLIRQATRELGLATTMHDFVAHRLHEMPHTAAWAAVESRLAEALSEWLARASDGHLGTFADEAEALGLDLRRQVAL